MICTLGKYKRDQVEFIHFSRELLLKQGFECIWTSIRQKECLDRADDIVRDPEEGDEMLAFTAQFKDGKEYWSVWVWQNPLVGLNPPAK